MKGFKNSTKMAQGHHFAAGGHVGHFAQPSPAPLKPANGDTVNGLTQRGTPDLGGHAAVHREVPSTDLESAHGGRGELLPGYGRGGQIGKPMKAFHVHNHYHNGKKMPGKKALEKIQRKAEGGLIGPKASPKVCKTSDSHQTPSIRSAFKGGGKIGPVKKGALHREMGIPAGEKIGKKRLTAAKRSGNPLEAKRANFALNMNKKATGGTIDKMNAGGAMYARGGKMRGC